MISGSCGKWVGSNIHDDFMKFRTEVNEMSSVRKKKKKKKPVLLLSLLFVLSFCDCL